MALGISEAVELSRTIGELVKKGFTLELQERITELREAILNAKDEVISLREENQTLRMQVRAQESWETKAAHYELVAMPGGALIYESAGPPPHYACPKCFEDHHIHILQDPHSTGQILNCVNCKSNFRVTPPQLPPRVNTRGPWR